MKCVIYLEDGSYYEGKAFGKIGTTVGELVFNTAMTGYQEILTDPSYAGQIINMTYPLIGNYGTNEYENESKKIHAKGIIVKNISQNPSNYKSQKDMNTLLNEMNIVGVYGVDTRSITKKIRNLGALKCVICSEDLSREDLKKIIDKYKYEEDYMEEVSTKKVINIKGDGFKVAVLDFGAKENIIRNLKNRNCDITIFPYNASYEEIMNIKPHGVFLSNGPGDPKDVKCAIETTKKLIGSIPIFGICLGHQIISLAIGADTYKMKYGHRGANHGIYDIDLDKSYITSQNHGYAVDVETLKNKDFVVTHINLNDNTVEGMRHKYLPIFSVQFHPEGAPGPIDSYYLFDKFINLMKGERLCQ